MDLNDWIPELNLASQLIIALIATFVLYFGFKKTAELGKHAAQNTAASILVALANIALVTAFLEDLNGFAQTAYNSLGIPTLDPKTWDKVPFLIVCLIGIATKDLADYANHRLMHTRWGWPTHAAHHSDTHVNAFSVYRVHFFEVVLMSFSYIVLLTWLQMPQALPMVLVLHSLHGMYVHMDLNFDHGPFKYLIASPVFHRWHHADTPEAYGKNLANMMPIYDVVFGTYYNPGPVDAPMGALKNGIEDKNPFLIYIYPFQEWARLIRAARAKFGPLWKARIREAAPRILNAGRSNQQRSGRGR